ncbi:MAG: hypothetical protein U9M90_04770 [Patescibacteria group bacterium]|nr:hypothetical protein [Patescibacteria group bacterium]
MTELAFLDSIVVDYASVAELVDALDLPTLPTGRQAAGRLKIVTRNFFMYYVYV